MDKLEEQGMVYLSDLWRREEFLTKEEIESIMKCKMNNFDYIKLKSFCATKPNTTKIRRDVVYWEVIFTANLWDKGLISRIYRELSQMYKNTSHSPINNRRFSEEAIKVIYSHM